DDEGRALVHLRPIGIEGSRLHEDGFIAVPGIPRKGGPVAELAHHPPERVAGWVEQRSTRPPACRTVRRTVRIALPRQVRIAALHGFHVVSPSMPEDILSDRAGR